MSPVSALSTGEEITFDRQARALRARAVRRYGALVAERTAAAGSRNRGGGGDLARGLVSLGLDVLPWSKALSQWRERVIFLRNAEGDEWPDLSDEALAATAEVWLAPHLVGRTGLERHHAGSPQRGFARPSAVEPAAAARRGSADPCGGADRLADRRSIMEAPRARFWPSGCRNCSVSTSIRRSPAGACR